MENLYVPGLKGFTRRIRPMRLYVMCYLFGDLIPCLLGGEGRRGGCQQAGSSCSGY